MTRLAICPQEGIPRINEFFITDSGYIKWEKIMEPEIKKAPPKRGLVAEEVILIE